jgi:hypothetical protein
MPARLDTRAVDRSIRQTINWRAVRRVKGAASEKGPQIVHVDQAVQRNFLWDHGRHRCILNFIAPPAFVCKYAI